ncbi:MAG: VCBS domain-containing protein [Magnetococcus sp. DMHC-8]
MHESPPATPPPPAVPPDARPLPAHPLAALPVPPHPSAAKPSPTTLPTAKPPSSRPTDTKPPPAAMLAVAPVFLQPPPADLGATSGPLAADVRGTLSDHTNAPLVLDMATEPVGNVVQVPSTAMLLEGEFHRIGDDLLIVGPDGERFTVQGYFAADQLATLTTLDGRFLLPETVALLLVSDTSRSSGTLVAGPDMVAEAGNAIGTASEVTGKVTAKNKAGVTRNLAKGDPIYQEDVVKTESGGLVKLTFKDKTLLQLGENANIVLNKYAYNPEAGEGNFEATVTRGMFKYASGDLAKQHAGRHSLLKTPTAQIGVRGSELQGEVTADGQTTVVHTAGVLDIADAQGQGTVTLLNPGTATVVTTGEVPKQPFQAPPALINQFSSQLPPVLPDKVKPDDGKNKEVDAKATAPKAVDGAAAETKAAETKAAEPNKPGATKPVAPDGPDARGEAEAAPDNAHLDEQQVSATLGDAYNAMQQAGQGELGSDTTAGAPANNAPATATVPSLSNLPLPAPALPAAAASVPSTPVVIPNLAPVLAFSPATATLVEAGGAANGTKGTQASTMTITKSDEALALYDVVGLTADGWSTADGGKTYSRAGVYGTATLTVANNTVRYVLDDSHATTQALTAGQEATDSFTIRVTDGALTTSADAVFRITGANDAPAMDLSEATDTLVEAGGVANATTGTAASSITLSRADVDSTVSYDAVWLVRHGWSTADSGATYTKAGKYGMATLTVATDVVRYVLDDSDTDTQALAEGQEDRDSFPFLVTDGALTGSADTVFQIVGTNDAPTLAVSAETAALVEAGGVANGTLGNAASSIALTKADVDTPVFYDTDWLTSNGWSTGDGGVTYTQTGTYGTATLTVATDVVSYVLDDTDTDTQALTVGQAVTDTFTVQVTDDALTAVDSAIFHVTGANDTPTLAISAPTATLVEAGGVANGTAGTQAAGIALTKADVDTPVFYDMTWLTSNGWSTADAGATYTQTGIYGTATLTVASDVVSYALNDSDVDTQALTAGQAVTDSFAVQVTDGLATTGVSAVFNVTGMNDTPTLAVSAATAGLVEAGGVANATLGTAASSITLTKADVDTPVVYDTTWLTGNGWSTADAGLTYSKTGIYGTATLTVAIDVVSYALNETDSDTQALTAGQSAADSFAIQVTDGAATTSADAVFHITGTNDTPTLAASASTATLVEAGGAANGTAGTNAASVTLSKADVDTPVVYDATWLTGNGWSTANAGVTYTQTGTYGTATLTVATNVVSYALNDSDTDTQVLTAGQSVSDSFVIQVTDGTATANTTVVFNVTGTNDTPTLAVVVADANNNAAPTVVTSILVEAGGAGNGTPGINTSAIPFAKGDVDGTASYDTAWLTGNGWTAGAGVFTRSGIYGTATLTVATDVVSYVLDDNDPDTQALTAGQSATDSFAIRVTDGTVTTSANAVFNIIGANDGAVSMMSSSVGYYDTSLGAGNSNQVASIFVAGLTPVLINAPSAGELAGLGVLYVQNPDNSGITGAEFRSSFADISNAVANGMTLIFHDRAALTAEAVATLPGFSGISLVRDPANPIDVLDPSNLFKTGPGGTVDNSTLDGGSSSRHGYAMAASLPAGAYKLLDTGDPNQIVAFSYSYGSGHVVYSTVPLDYYLYGASAFSTVYAPNILAYGAHLVTPTLTAGAPTATLVEAGGVANGTGGTSASSITMARGIAPYDTSWLVGQGWTTADGVTYAKTGTYGSATLNVVSNVVGYALNNADTDTQGLASGQSVTDSFAIRATSGVLTANANAVFNITGGNDAPTFTSGTTGTVAENAATSTTVYTAVASDVDIGNTRTYSLSGTDAASFNINASTGVVKLNASANYEAKSSYDFNVIATDTGGLTATQAVTVTVTNVNEAPTMTSGTSGSVAENAAPGSLVYTATASDVDAGDTQTYSLGGGDAAALSINSSTGAVTLNASADYEAKSSYSFNVIATDAGGLTATQAVTVSVTNVNEAMTGSVTVYGTDYAGAGTVIQGQTLTTSNTISDPDGLSNIAYQWQANGVNIPGATGSSLVVPESVRGQLVTVVATGTDVYGVQENRMSNAINVAYDAYADFSMASNPNSVWAYMYAYDIYAAPMHGMLQPWHPNDVWAVTTSGGGPLIFKPGVPDFLALHPSATEWMDLVFTVPAAGTYNVNVVFRSGGPDTTTDAGVFSDYTGWIFQNLPVNPQTQQQANFTVFMPQGNNIEFFVGSGGNGEASDTTAVQVTITRCQGDPLVLDLNGDGIHLTEKNAGPRFDMNGDTIPDPVGWIGSEDGLLVLDQNGDGRIENLREVISEQSAANVTSSLAALATMDSNRDGQIDANDNDFSRLQVWVDQDQDGISASQELFTLAQLGIASLGLTSDEAGPIAMNGNTITGFADVTYADGHQGTMAEVLLDFEPTQQADAPAGIDGDSTVPGPGQLADILHWEGAALQRDGDTLKLLDTGSSLDLTNLLANQALTGIQKVDMTGAGNNILNIHDIMDFAGSEYAGLIQGDAGDVVNIQNAINTFLAANTTVVVDGVSHATDATGHTTIGADTYVAYSTADHLHTVLVGDEVLVNFLK